MFLVEFKIEQSELEIGRAIRKKDLQNQQPLNLQNYSSKYLDLFDVFTCHRPNTEIIFSNTLI